MGQQQLLLLVLGIFIVATAVVIALTSFDENFKKANADAMISDAMRIANSAQAWKLRPAAFGGQDESLKTTPQNFTGFTLAAISVPEPYINEHGSFTYNADALGLVIVGENTVHNNRITLTVDGIEPEDIFVVISTLD